MTSLFRIVKAAVLGLRIDVIYFGEDLLFRTFPLQFSFISARRMSEHGQRGTLCSNLIKHIGRNILEKPKESKKYKKLHVHLSLQYCPSSSNRSPFQLSKFITLVNTCQDFILGTKTSDQDFFPCPSSNQQWQGHEFDPIWAIHLKAGLNDL